MATLTTVVAYDISDDRRRARVAATIQVWGDRIQRSVFVARLDGDQLVELNDQLTRIIDPDVDSVYVFRQCAACWEEANTIGQATTQEPPPYWSVL